MLLPRGNFTLVYRSLTEFMVAFNNTNDLLFKTFAKNKKNVS